MIKQVSAYIHIPYCISKCGYCDFNSYPDREGEYGDYTQAVLTELATRGRAMAGASVPSIFFGGGTPTVLSTERLTSILDRCRTVLTLDHEPEISVEANPETITPPLLESLLSAGFNRISIGVQSFDDGNLRLLGRTHSGAQAVEAINRAAEAGFENISLDLMFGIPGQDTPQWREDIHTALSLNPQHISAYELKVEEKTPFHRLIETGVISLPDEESRCEMYSMALERFTEAGLERYEISNFARPGFRCRHNLNYWRNGEYLGLGAGAHSFLGGVRSSNAPEPLKYMTMVTAGGRAVDFQEKLSSRAALGEALMLGLRLTEGIDMEAYSTRYGIPLQGEYGETLSELSGQGLIEMEGGRLKLTDRGVLLSDEVFLKFL
jgi:oxygen-independent coproporphyrinogen-3 oxidase